MSDFLLPAGLFAAAIAIYILRERHRRRTEVRPAHPDLAMDAVAAEDLRPPARAELLEIERRALDSENPRRTVRAAILANTATALHLEAIAELAEPERRALLQGYEPGMDALLREALAHHQTIAATLRHYARLKFDDAVPNDWHDRFLHHARPYIREKVRLARDYLMQVDASAGRFAEIYDALLEELRAASLAAPPKRRFPPAGLA